MFIQLTNAAPPFKGHKLIINSEHIISVYADEVKWVKKDSDLDANDVEEEQHTCIACASYGVNGLSFVQESIEEVFAIINTKS